MKELNIFSYTDYRSYLIHTFKERKSKNNSWSFESWARILELSDNSSLLKIINGHREAGPKIIQRLIKYYRFTKDESLYFQDLVKLSKAKKDPRLSLLLLEKMQKKYPNNKFKLLDQKEFSLISNWWFIPIRQMMSLDHFKEDPIWIANKLKFHVTPSEIKKCIEIMLELGFIKRNAEGILKALPINLTTTDDITCEAIKNFHEGMLENARRGVRATSVIEREYTSQTFIVNKTDLPKAKEKIRQFMDDFSRMFEVPNGDEVYQLQTQFFPITNLNDNKKERQ